MKLRDLLEVFNYVKVELHEGMEGKLVATHPKSLEKFSNVEVLSAYPKIKANRDHDFVYAYLYVFGDSTDIKHIKEEADHGQE